MTTHQVYNHSRIGATILEAIFHANTVKADIRISDASSTDAGLEISVAMNKLRGMSNQALFDKTVNSIVTTLKGVSQVQGVKIDTLIDFETEFTQGMINAFNKRGYTILSVEPKQINNTRVDDVCRIAGGYVPVLVSKINEGRTMANVVFCTQRLSTPDTGEFPLTQLRPYRVSTHLGAA